MAIVLTLMASMAYSTWKMRPSGLKQFTPLSYSFLVIDMVSASYVSVLLLTLPLSAVPGVRLKTENPAEKFVFFLGKVTSEACA